MHVTIFLQSLLACNIDTDEMLDKDRLCGDVLLACITS